MTERSKHNRKQLLWRIALLALGYVLPLGGLLLFLLLSGVHSRIGFAGRERAGLRYIRQVIAVHEQVVREMWDGSGPAAPERLSAEIGRLEKLERELAPQLFVLDDARPRRASDLTAQELNSAWTEARALPAGDPERVENLFLLLGQLQALTAHTSDSAGLTFSPDAETEYLNYTIAFTLPVHVEHLVQMREQLRRLAATGSRIAGSQVAGIFHRQLEKELPRLQRSIELALEGDARSEHVTPEFHRDYPPAAKVFLGTLGRLSAMLDPAASVERNWEAVFRESHKEAMAFWRLSVDQLDGLLEDQIEHARYERNAALAIGALVLATLLPLTWLYYRRYIRPIVQDLVDEVRESAEAAARAKNQFLAMMSHEIRTPMNGVIGFSNLLAETKLDAQQRDFVRTITSSSEALLTIINDILDYTKLEAERVELESRPVNIRDLVEDVVGLLSTAANAKQLELVCWVEPDVPEAVRADPTRLRQILLNLAGNAVKFTAKGHIEVVVARVAPIAPGVDRIAFCVRDTGIGIPPERLDRLFKPFSQVDSSITRTHGGTGLGLAISYRLVKVMGGEITVNSEPGKGTEFRFAIPAPATAPAEVALAGALDDEEVNRALRGQRILLVDDYEANRRLFARLFEQHGARVVTVESAEAALRAAATESFDLGIFDYMMPGMDGIELAQKLTPQLPPKRIILVTSVSLGPSETPAGLFAAVILKPVRHRRFLAAIVGVLQNKPAVAEPKAAPATKAPPFALQHPLRILAVDDNPVNLRVISMMLTGLGYAPAVTDRAEKAIERLRTDPFDLILMDVQMPDMDGLEATRLIRAGQAGPLNRETRIVALTAGATAQEREACSAAGMDEFLVKPILRPALLETLAQASAAKRPEGESERQVSV